MAVGRPPADVPPERLFRFLMPLRPILPIEYRIRCALDVPLLVRAMSSAEEQGALDVAADGPEEVRSGRAQLEVLARCLWTPTGQAFESADDVGRLDEADVDALAAAAAEALGKIAPVYARSDGEAWGCALLEGARHYTNLATSFAMATCMDHGPRYSTQRPDRYWGVPVAELLDGHWMLFRAAHKATEALGKK